VKAYLLHFSCVVALLVFFAEGAHASDFVTIDFSGRITRSLGIPEIPLGTNYTGQITYDTNHAPEVGSSPNYDVYNIGGSQEGIYVTVGTYTCSSLGTSDSQIVISNQASPGYIFSVGNDKAEPNGTFTNLPGYTSILYTQFILQGTQGLASPLPLPTTINFADMTPATLDNVIQFGFDVPSDGQIVELVGNIEAINISAISDAPSSAAPEPASIWLVGFALTISGLTVRYRCASKS